MQRWILLGVIGLALGAFFLFDLGEYLTLANLKAQQDNLAAYRAANPLVLAAGYFVVYVMVTALSLPGATIMTLAGGAVFGFSQGLLLVSFASSVGATAAFLVARFLLHDWVQQRFGERIAPVNRGIEKDGAFYLFSLRLVPLFPFFMINLVMGLTPLKAWTFYWVSQVGMLAGTAVYVNAGTQLAQLDSLGGILSPSLLASFALLGLFPLVARKTMAFVNHRRKVSSEPTP
ncbi:MAG: TVP38/TMEM64 family protein [Saccharospirillum sp.]